MIIEIIGKFCSLVFSPLLKLRFILKIYNFIFNNVDYRTVRFTNKYIYLPLYDYDWKIKLINGKTVLTRVQKNNILTYQFPLSYRRHSPSFNYLEFMLNKYFPDNVPWIDVGSNLGLRSLLPLSEGREVYFIEPNKEANKTNKERCILNKYKNYIFFEVGASNSSGYQDFFIDKSSYNSSLEEASLKNSLFIYERKERIAIDTIDNLFRDKINIFPTAYIKIDVEGHELKVLEGASEFIKKLQPTMIIEVNEKGLHFADFICTISCYDYELFEICSLTKGKLLRRINLNCQKEIDSIRNNDFLITKDNKLIEYIESLILGSCTKKNIFQRGLFTNNVCFR